MWSVFPIRFCNDIFLFFCVKESMKKKEDLVIISKKNLIVTFLFKSPKMVT